MANIQLTDNFYISEFMCHDGTNVPYDLVDNVTLLAKNLQVLRDYFGLPIKIISGYRNYTYNDVMTNGELNSYHIKAMAADIRIQGKTPKQVYSAIEKLIKEGKMKNGGLGSYNTFVHYDIGPANRRW